MPLQKTDEGKWVVYHRVTGQRVVRWPVDARGMLATGEYTGEASECATPPVGDAPERTSTVVPPNPSIDPVPHVTKANAENAARSPTGAPLAIAPSDGVSPAAPVTLPRGRKPVTKE